MRAENLAFVAALAVLAHARTASAGELALTWTAPPGCPTTSELRDAVLRGGAGAEPGERIEAVAHVEHGDRWSVTLQTSRAGIASPERRLEATSCRALADATAVILALALIPEGTAPPAGDGPPETAPAATPRDAAPVTTSPPAAATAPPPAAAAAPDAQSRERGARAPELAHPTFAASASVATDAATLPSPAVGARAALAWTPGHGRLELSGSYFAAQSQTTGVSPAGASFASGVLGARAGWTVLRGVVELSPRAGADVELVRARGFGAANNYDASAAWLSAAAGALVVVPLASFLALRADADAIAPLSRPRFVVDGEGAVHHPPAFGLRAGIGAELRFL
jgi:hypothetical protein